jgi:hypothetical protein
MEQFYSHLTLEFENVCEDVTSKGSPESDVESEGAKICILSKREPRSIDRHQNSP